MSPPTGADSLRIFSTFGRENYLHIDGQPVLCIYASTGFYGDVASAFREAFRRAGVDPYLLADVRFGAPPDVFPITKVADTVTAYNPYSARPDIEEVFHDRYEKGNHVFHLSSRGREFGYVPVVLPGYNDTEIPDSQREDNPVLGASPTRYERVLGQIQPHLSGAPATLITSFNEWYENTQIEPHEQYEQQYLDLTAGNLATGSAPAYQPPQGTTVTIEWGAVVSEQSLNPDASTDRKLAFLASRIRLLGAGGEEVASYDVGSDGPLFVNGAYGRESNGTRTWRWLGGYQMVTRFRAVVTGSVTAVELEGRVAEDMEVTLRASGQSTSKQLRQGTGTYRFDL